jgi:hypothetical protein
MKSALFAAFAVAAGAFAGETPEQLRGMVRKSMAGLQLESERRDHYLFKTRGERNELDSSGKVAQWHGHYSERVEIEGVPFLRTLQRDGKALTAKERKEEDSAIQRRLAELRVPAAATASVVDPAATVLSRRPSPKKDDWFLEFPEALDFKIAGEEIIEGRPTVRVEAVPRLGYQAGNIRARVFEKMKGSLWIDRATSELVKADAEMFDTVSVGFGVLGKVEKGTRFRTRRRMLADGTWLMEFQSLRFGARLLFKTLRNESTTEWWDFRRRPSSVAASPTLPKSRP